MNIAIYSRVSTGKQDADNQLIQLREFAAKQGWTVHKEYVDYASGAKSDRVEFQKMFTDASKRRFDLVLFWALDRLSREGTLETLQHLNRLASYGVCYRSFTEQFFDSCGVFKDAIISIMATLAKQERVKLSDRTKAGLARTRAAGTRLGRPEVTVKPATVLALRAQRLSMRAIGRKLGISAGTAQRLASASAQ
jgi:DNA invertase Pin-like site-specific DNA recombinase